MKHSEQYLVELALQGDTACSSELFERWWQRIYGFICRYIGNPDEAQDLTQDTFTKAYRNLDRLSDPKRFSSWLYTIALNECRMRFRRWNKIRLVPLPEEQRGLREGLRVARGPQRGRSVRQSVDQSVS